MPPKDKYSDPKLRDEVKKEIHNGDKGGAPGQWSARKAQMMASEYKKRGGGYNTDKKDQDESQKHLSKWGEEEWQTKEGSANAKQADGTQKRYLPKKAWENMTEEEKQATDDKKQEGGKEGKQHVGNTKKAKESREKANKEEDEKYEEKKAKEKEQAGDDAGETNDGEEANEADGDEEYVQDDEAPADEDEEEGDEHSDQDEAESEASGGAKAGQKRSRGKQSDDSSNKKQKESSGKAKQSKTVGSKHQSSEAPAPAGSKDRLPKQGQKVQWKSLPGYIDGEVVEVVYEEKEVDGKQVKGSEKDPRIVLKSSSSGKIAVHKPEAIFFE
ncbi:hypothetical protein M8818_002670 [Zalaria obscura]|uniref:Uncharacterized protein n=1 Tax=Zalaria obscura TaxID=2024903 RepID=A0ACC3SIK0_9PEZI